MVRDRLDRIQYVAKVLFFIGYTNFSEKKGVFLSRKELSVM